VGGVTSGVLGGIIADWLSSSAVDAEDPTGRKLWVPVVGSVLAVPAFYYSIHGGSFELAMLCLAIEYLVAECWFGPTISVLQSTVGPKIGGTAQGLFTLTGAIGNLAPSILGFVYGRAAGIDPSGELADILAVTVCSLYLASAACFIVSSLSVPPPKTTISEQQRSVSGATGKSKRQ
jgi:MFS family permease